MQRGERRHRKVEGGLFGQREPGRIAAELPTATRSPIISQTSRDTMIRVVRIWLDIRQSEGCRERELPSALMTSQVHKALTSPTASTCTLSDSVCSISRD